MLSGRASCAGASVLYCVCARVQMCVCILSVCVYVYSVCVCVCVCVQELLDYSGATAPDDTVQFFIARIFRHMFELSTGPSKLAANFYSVALRYGVAGLDERWSLDNSQDMPACCSLLCFMLPNVVCICFCLRLLQLQPAGDRPGLRMT